MEGVGVLCSSLEQMKVGENVYFGKFESSNKFL